MAVKITSSDISIKQNNTSLGLVLPLNSTSGSILELSYTTKQQMISNFKNLILTAKGERLMNPTFGTNIKRTLFNFIDDDYESNVISDIEDATKTFCPYINILEISVTSTNTTKSVVTINIKFSVSNDTTYTENIQLIVSSEGTIQLL